VAAKLRKEGSTVTTKHGAFGELRVEVDGRDVYVGNRFLYSTPGRVLRAVRQAMTGIG
jgi:hypothetical protein